MCAILFRGSTHFLFERYKHLIYLIIGLFIIIVYTLYVEFVYNSFCERLTLDISQNFNSWIERITFSNYHIDISTDGHSMHFFCLTKDNTPVFRWIYDWEMEQVVFLRVYDRKEYKAFKREYK
jgi:hypothetical protein